MNCCRPAGARVQELLARAVRQVANRAFRDPILEMGVHAAQSKSLSRSLACLFEGVVLESAIVAVVMRNFDAVVGGELLEGALGLDCFVGSKILHQMYEAQSGIMVHEDGGAFVAAIGEFACHLREKSHLR